jgi:hypothetical protein
VRIVVWNMNHRLARKNWSLFKQRSELVCDIALLNEATPPPADLGLNIETEEKTIGRDDRSHGGKKVRGWAAAVASPHPLEWPLDV